MNELGVFAEYAKRLGSGPDRDVGEATVLAWAECHEAIAIVDETAGRQVGKERNVEVHGTLWLLTEAVNRRLIRLALAGKLVDELRAAGAFLPCDGEMFERWARDHGLLDPD